MTPRQRKAEQEVRRRAAALLADLDAFKVDIAELRRGLLSEPGVDLLATKIRRRRGARERLDLLRYRRPGGPRRASYWIVRWGSGWEHTPIATLGEARLWFDGWGALPAWHRAPLLIEESDRE